MNSTRKVFIGGNWKSNNTLAKSQQLVADVVNKLDFDISRTEVLVAPVSLHVQTVQQHIKNSTYVAVQTIGKYGFGAYTGEVSVEHVLDLGIKWTLLGHSERRNLKEINESDELIAEKAALAVTKGVSVVYCIGELLEQRESNQTFSVLETQLAALQSRLQESQWDSIVLAYEPVWAIGTGKTASPAQAQEVHAFIRNWLSTKVSANVADKTRIIYGGSVTKDNAVELIGQTDVDGFLVGGASLKEDFIHIVSAAKSKQQ